MKVWILVLTLMTESCVNEEKESKWKYTTATFPDQRHFPNIPFKYTSRQLSECLFLLSSYMLYVTPGQSSYSTENGKRVDTFSVIRFLWKILRAVFFHTKWRFLYELRFLRTAPMQTNMKILWRPSWHSGVLVSAKHFRAIHCTGQMYFLYHVLAMNYPSLIIINKIMIRNVNHTYFPANHKKK